MGVRINISWGEGPVLAAHARRQYDNAVLGTQNYFRISLPNAPAKHEQTWSQFMTDKINRVMKRNDVYTCQLEYQAAAILGGGIGPMTWRGQYSWCPSFVRIGDLRVPTDTNTSLEEIGWFAERHSYTPGELARKVFGRNSVAGWNKPEIQKILHAYRDLNYENTSYDWNTSPERMADLYRQNGGFYSSDAMPTISLWHFFFQDDSDPMNPCWKMRVIPDWGDHVVMGVTGDKWLYTTNESCASKVEQMLHVQFGDFNSDPPFKYYSVRSLGFMLVEPCFYRNLTLCRQLQHLHEALNIMFRVSDPAGRMRAQKIQLFDRAILEEGVSIVAAAERHQVDSRLVDSVMAQLKQLQAEVGQSYTQSIDTGTAREQTAFETHAKLTAVNAMMSGLLGRWARKAISGYREIGRRFCLRDTKDDDAKKFQKDCDDFGIPKEFVNVEQWDIETEMPVGGGNPTLAMASAEQLMKVRPLHDSAGQQEILHIYDETIVGAKMAERLVPLDKARDVTDSMRDAEFAFGTMMHGVPVRMKQGTSPIDEIETFLGLMAGVIARIEHQSNLATPSELAGLQNVGQFTGQLIQQLSQNPQEKQRVKQYGDVLGKLMNSVKGFAQRLQEAASKNGQSNLKESLGLQYKDFPPSIQRQVEAMLGFKPAMEVEAQVDPKTAKSMHSIATKEAGHRQKQRNQQIAFRQEQLRKDAGTFAEIQRQNAKTATELRNQQAKAKAEIKIGQEIARAGKKYKVTGKDKDGEPLVDEA
jgi:hypothetical protein